MADGATTVRRETGRAVTVEEVRAQVADGYSAAFGVSLVPGDFTADERRDIAMLEHEKYLTEAWVHQTSAVPDTMGAAKIKTPGGLLDVRVTLAGPTIKAAFVGGDFFAGEGAVADLEASLRWHTSEPEAVAATLTRAHAGRAADLASLPLGALVQAVQQAIRRARLAESAARADPYGCFVNPGGQGAESVFAAAEAGGAHG